MEAFWIINLSESAAYAANYLEFKNNYKAATGYSFDNLLYEEINFADPGTSPANSSLQQKLDQFIKDSVQSLPVRWPYFGKLGVQDRLNIIITGDLDESNSRQFFHILPSEIRQYQIGVKAFPLSSVNISGIISYNFDANHHFSEQQTLFLTQLNMLMKNPRLNLVPFDEIFFFQKPAHGIENHYTRISQFLLASVLNRKKLTANHSYNEAGSACVYFEHDVQVHNEASLLSAILLNSFNFKTTKLYLNPEEAERFVRDSALVKNDLLGHTVLTERLRENASQPDFDRAESGKKLRPVRFMFHPSIITDYYHDFIPRLIQKLVNECGSIALRSYQKFLITLQQNKLRILNNTETGPGYRTQIADLVFQLFSKPEVNCSLEQQKAVLSEIDRITEDKAVAFSQDAAAGAIDVKPFSVPKKYAHFYEQARKKELTEEQVLKNLESNLRSHPVISAKLIRAVLLGLTFLVTVGPLLAWLAEHRVFDIGPSDVVKYVLWALSLFFPLIVAAWQIRGLLNRIRMYQEQYKACLLARINEKAEADMIQAINETYGELAAYYEVLGKRRQRTAEKLRAMDFRKNSFKSNELFQPLWESNPPVLKDRDIRFDCGHSGIFQDKELLKSFPGNRLRYMGDEIHFTDLLDKEDVILALIRDLMDEQTLASVSNYSEFVRTNSFSAILLLDISGSMGENMPDGKAKIEHLREAIREINASDMKWVAFSDDVYKDEHGHTIFTKDTPIPDPGGNTYLAKGFRHLKAMAREGFDKIILVSDGLPFDREEALNEALSIGVPVDVIYIGNDDSGRIYMGRLASETHGKMVQASEIDLLSRLNEAFSIEIRDRTVPMKFWELLKFGYYEECAMAAHEFARRLLLLNTLTTSELLDKYFNPEGVEAWAKSSDPSCALRPGLAANPVSSYYTGVDVLTNLSLTNILNAAYLATPDTVVIEILRIRSLAGLSSLLINIDQASEEQVFNKFRKDLTTEIAMGYLGKNIPAGIFPGTKLI